MPVPLSLNQSRDQRLERSPLRLVVCQVRHERIAAVADAARALKVHEALADEFPKIEEISEESVNVAGGPSGIAVNRSEAQRGWHFRSEDETWTISLTQKSFSMETTTYDRWAGFRARLGKFASLVDEVTSPKIEQRLGLRFIDEIVYPEVSEPTGLKGLIVNELLGPLSVGPMSGSIRSTEQLIVLEGSADVRVNLRHGCQPSEGAVTYLLDIDCYRQTGQRFDVTGILKETDRLHETAKQVFEASVTEELYGYLVGEQQ